ncbi:adenosine deaminase/editase [Xylaria castorea]|nr:adenosine deaminase/editase [Xylaria castorea]
MTVKSDLIASLVQQEFAKLPAKRKPVVRDNGLREWVPLSGIVAEGKDGQLTCLSLATGMKCLPSSKLQKAKGNVLHDWHAEILAIRAFNCFVLDECQALASGSKSSSPFIRHRSSAEMMTSSSTECVGSKCDGEDKEEEDKEEEEEEEEEEEGNWHGQPFAWRDDVLLYMYCSEAPCGDASMELTMASQADATPWTIPPQENPSSPSFSATSSTHHTTTTTTTTTGETDTLLPGRAYFSQLGIVRRKPSRGDAPPTLSKSCSDKLSLHQCTSLLSSVTSLLVSPEHAYIATLILPAAQYSASGCRRAFSDGAGRRNDEDEEDEGDAGLIRQQQEEARMAPLATRIQGDGGYAFRPFSVETTDLEFVFSRRSSAAAAAASTLLMPPSCFVKTKITPSNLSTAHTASNRTETTLNGVLQGRKASAAEIRGASFASRRRTWGLAIEVAGLLALDAPNQPDRLHILHIRDALGAISVVAGTGTGTGLTYAQVKNCASLGPRRRAKEAARREALRGWVRNLGDEDFVL